MFRTEDYLDQDIVQLAIVRGLAGFVSDRRVDGRLGLGKRTGVGPVNG
jgi:hypothetical protein